MLAPPRSTFEAVCNEFEPVEQKLPKLFIKPIQHIRLDGKKYSVHKFTTNSIF